MSLALQFSTRDALTDSVTLLTQQLGSNRAGLHQAIGDSVQKLCREHFALLQSSRHNRLGAPSSNYFAQAAATTTCTVDGDAVTVRFDQPGLARAARDLTITPTPPRRYLAIPLIAAAYQQRASQIKGLVAIQTSRALLLVQPQKRTGTGSRSSLGTVWYVLVKSVTQKQDPTLLPSDDAFFDAARQGARQFIDQLLPTTKATQP